MTVHDHAASGQGTCEGYTHPAFAEVREAFASNLRTGDELGGSVAVYHHGRLVVDLWGGTRDPGGAPYPGDALHVAYSVTKGVMGLVLASLMESRHLELDVPVADYWPDFAGQGKADVLVGQLASHQAGLPAFAEPTTLADLADWELCTRRLAAQAPAWTPGAAHGYHALTLGYLVGEVMRRATGHTVGQLLRERFDDGELQAWIGLPSEFGDRVVPACEAPPAPGTGAITRVASTTPGTISHAVASNPALTASSFNDASTWAAEIPAANGVFDARSLAKLYSSAIDGPLRSLGEATVEQVRRPRVDGPDLVLVDQPTRFGAAFMTYCTRQPMLGPGSFGHDGLGGHLAFAHPESGIAFAYLSNRAVPDPGPHARVWRLLAAVSASM
jgi:CubicO group peptidase (beta-lactamase class C family)